MKAAALAQRYHAATMQLSDVIEAIARGRTVTDIGQLTREGKAWLRAEVRAERVESFRNFHFPQPKSAWRRLPR